MLFFFIFARMGACTAIFAYHCMHAPMTAARLCLSCAATEPGASRSTVVWRVPRAAGGYLHGVRQL